MRFLPTVLLCLAPLASQAKSWKHPDGTTHWYEPVIVSGGIDWPTAHAAAAVRGGYLATLTTPQENSFVFGLIDDPKFWSTMAGVYVGPWLGGLQPGGSKEPAGGWQWGEFESFGYQNWSAGQPDDNAKADRLHYGGGKTGRAPWWSDDPAATKLTAFVVEYSGATAPRTVGLQRRDPGSFEGLTLFNPRLSQKSFLIDSRGRVVREWVSTYVAGLPATLLPDGHLVRAGRLNSTSFSVAGYGGILEKFDWAGKRVWSFPYSTSSYCQHHDFAVMPNGNLLIVAWELRSRAECVQAGRDPAKLSGGVLWPDKIIEVQPNATGGTIVWKWHAWDHLIQDFDAKKSNFGKVADHPELVDVNYTFPGRSDPDWMHVNSIHYHPKLDQILIGVPMFGEVWVIDHSTTTALAKGHVGGRSGKGGDLLYRWGNPRTYRAGTTADQKLFFQHDARWIESGLPGAGNILIFNNGRGRKPAPYSSVDEIAPPAPDTKGNYARAGKEWGPAKPLWSYTTNPPTDFFAGFMSSAQRLPNGHTLICDGPKGRLFEVTKSGAPVWQYSNPTGNAKTAIQGDVVQNTDVFRVTRYAPDFPAFKNRNLTPGGPIERYTTALLADGSSLRRRARIGTRVELTITTQKANAGRFYQVVTSATPGLIPVDFRFARLGVDPLLFQTLANAIPTVFQRYLGQLDTSGAARASIAVPALPVLAGLDLYSTFVVVDAAAPSSLGVIANTVVVRLEL